MSDLFHFTDRRGAHAIGRYGMIIPRRSLALAATLAWFTDDTTLSRVELGLTMTFTIVDRMEFLYRVVDARTCEPFLDWAKRTGNLLASVRLIDEERRPQNWFVSEFAVPVRQIRDYVPGWTPTR